MYLLIHPSFSTLPHSLRKKYGKVYSMKVGSFKTVIAEDVASVKEVLVKKSADYAGRPPFHSFVMSTLGMCNQNSLSLRLIITLSYILYDCF